VYGVLFLGWSPVEAFIVYALETMLVGAVTVLQMAIVTIWHHKHTWYFEGGTKQVGGLFFIFFFIFHYGLFALVQTSIFSQVAGIVPAGKGLMHFFFHWYEYVNSDILLMLAAFVVSYAGRVVLPFIVSGEYKTVSMMRLMFQPYGRIFIQQVTVIVGSMFLQLGLAKAFIVVFALAKIWFEVYIDLNALLRAGVAGLEKRASGKK